MDPSTLLSQLRDAHAPETISFWPIALGWWVLLIAILILISIGIYITLSRWRSKAWKRQAKKHFIYLREQYLKSPSLEGVVEINKLLKQVMSSANNDRHFLQLYGADWESILYSVKHNQHNILNEDEIQILCSGIYSSTQPSLDNNMLDRIALWIRCVK